MTSDHVTTSRNIFEQEALPHQPFIYQAAYSLLGSRGEAEDAVQETYLQAWKLFQRFRPGTNCRAWMSSILFNVVRHERRRWMCRFRATAEAESFERSIPARAMIYDELTDPEILAALHGLPRSYAAAVELAYVGEFSYKEISDALGCPIGTVMSRISRGRQLLRKSLTQEAMRRGIVRGKSPLVFHVYRA